jgi:phosphoserine aminotransferase
MKANKTSIYNFGAGPACLPLEVLAQIREDIPDWYDGMSVMEVSHRSPKVMDMLSGIESDLKQLLKIPDEFAILLMQGGARAQFSGVPLNLSFLNPMADYLVTGFWSDLAFHEGKKYCNAQMVATGLNENFSTVPPEETWECRDGALYLHFTDNETIHGLELPHFPIQGGAWLVCDMTSNILTKPIDFSRIGLIYASAQKNLGIAGMTLVIVRRSLITHPHPLTPSTMNYELFDKSQSLYNTAPVFCWYVFAQILKWTLRNGGVEHFAKLSKQKTQLIYDIIDKSNIYVNPVDPKYRSRLNVPFSLIDEKKEAQFLEEANRAGLKQLKGHKIVGGCRASMYNAMPLEGAQALANFMQEFEEREKAS